MTVDEYRTERDRHGHTLTGAGCRCGLDLTGAALTGHLSAAIADASRRLHRAQFPGDRRP